MWRGATGSVEQRQESDGGSRSLQCGSSSSTAWWGGTCAHLCPLVPACFRPYLSVRKNNNNQNCVFQSERERVGR